MANAVLRIRPVTHRVSVRKAGGMDGQHGPECRVSDLRCVDCEDGVPVSADEDGTQWVAECICGEFTSPAAKSVVRERLADHH